MRLITLPTPLADWIDRHMPAVGGIRHVRIYATRRLPFQWLFDRRERFDGLTLWNCIYLRERACATPGREWVALLLHELVHVQQFRRSRIIFPLSYLLRLARHGYWNHPAELEARDVSEQLYQRYCEEMDY